MERPTWSPPPGWVVTELHDAGNFDVPPAEWRTGDVCGVLHPRTGISLRRSLGTRIAAHAWPEVTDFVGPLGARTTVHRPFRETVAAVHEALARDELAHLRQLVVEAAEQVEALADSLGVRS
jgi:hypothetical protein